MPIVLRGGIAQLVECQTKMSGAVLIWVHFPETQLSVQTLLQRLCILHAQSHASASVLTVKIPNGGSHTVV